MQPSHANLRRERPERRASVDRVVLLACALAAACADHDARPADGGTTGTGTLEVHQINVGWGGSVLIRGPDGTTILLEAGNTSTGAGAVVPYLEAHGIPPAAGLDYTIAGHHHCDHIGGMDEVVQAGYDVRRKNYDNGSTYTTGCVEEWQVAAAQTMAGPLVVPQPGERIPLGDGAVLTILAVNGDVTGGRTVSVSDENDRSIAVLVQYHGFDYLWASDLGGGDADHACTGRTTAQVDVESAVMAAILPGGASPLITAGGIDVMTINHHGSPSSTNPQWMNGAAAEVALIGVGRGQSDGWDFPQKSVVEEVLLGEATGCITAPPARVLQTEEGSPTGASTSFRGYSVGNIRITTDGNGTYTVFADGQVTEGPNEVAAAGLPVILEVDDPVR